MYPSFIIAGATNSGIETIRTLLCQNSALYMPQHVTPSFFCRAQRYEKGLAVYETFFAEAGPHQVAGELSPGYFEHGIIFDAKNKYLWSPRDDSAIRIKKHFPEMKIVIALRNPVERLWLQFSQAQKNKRTASGSFEDTIRQEMKGERTPESDPLCYLYRNQYSVHVQHWKKLFGAANLHVCFYEDLNADPAGIINGIERFAGVRPRNFQSAPLSPSARKSAADTGGDGFYESCKARYPLVGQIEDRILNFEPVKKYLEKVNSAKQNSAAETIAEPETEAVPTPAAVRLLPKKHVSEAFEAELKAYFKDDAMRLQDLLKRSDVVDLWQLN